MAYRIRYGKEIKLRRSRWQFGGFRILTALLLTLFVVGLRLGWERGAQKMSEILASKLETVTEQTVRAMADSLAAGEGWYHALAVWCRAILDMGMA